MPAGHQVIGWSHGRGTGHVLSAQRTTHPPDQPKLSFARIRSAHIGRQTSFPNWRAPRARAKLAGIVRGLTYDVAEPLTVRGARADRLMPPKMRDTSEKSAILSSLSVNVGTAAQRLVGVVTSVDVVAALGATHPRVLNASAWRYALIPAAGYSMR